MELQMKVACDSRADAVELVHRMEGSKHFQGAQLVDASEASQSGNIAASVTAVYVPDLISDGKDQREKDSSGEKDKSRKDRSRK
jgi:hypothetical protein